MVKAGRICHKIALDLVVPPNKITVLVVISTWYQVERVLQPFLVSTKGFAKGYSRSVAVDEAFHMSI